MADFGNKFNLQAQNIGTVVYHNHAPSDPQEASEDINQAKSETRLQARCGADRFQVYRLEGECEKLINSSKYLEAVEQLKLLHEYQPDHLNTMLMLVECYCHLNMFDCCVEMSKKIRESILEAPRPETRDLILMAGECKRKKKRVISLVLLWSCCSLCTADRSPRDALDGIKECIQGIFDLSVEQRDETGVDAIRNMFRFISIDYRLICDIERIVRDININDIASHKRVLYRCLGHKAFCCITLQRLDEALGIYHHCIDDMEEEFGSNACQFYLYSEFLCNASSCYRRKGDKVKCKEFIRKAQSAIPHSQPATEVEKAQKELMMRSLFRQ